MSGFKQRTIRTVLRNRVDRLLATITDDVVKEAMRKDILVTGGSITSMLMGEKVNDYDIYFRSFETAHMVAEYYVKTFNAAKKAKNSDITDTTPEVRTEERTNIKGEVERRILVYMRSAGVEAEERKDYKYFEHEPEGLTDDFISSLSDAENDMQVAAELAEEVKTTSHTYRPIFLTDNAITLSDKMQIIIRFYGTPEQIHRNFDYIHCTGVYDYAADKLTITPEMMESVMSKSLVYSGSLYPLASVLRMRKFIKRGWRISAGQVIKMLEQVTRVDFTDVNVLKEQLMGVDVAYMHELIRALENREPGQRIDATYLGGLLDQVFED